MVQLINVTSGRQCTICLEAVPRGTTALGHGQEGASGNVFHEGCLRSWFLAGHATCPLCRARITSVNGQNVRVWAVAQRAVNRQAPLPQDLRMEPDAAALEAARQGNAEEIEGLIAAAMEARRAAQGRALDSRALDSAEIILRGSVLMEAAIHGQLETVRILARSDDMPFDDIVLAGMEAGYAGFPEIAQLLHETAMRPPQPAPAASWCAIL